MDRFQFLKTFGIALGVGVLNSKPLVANGLQVLDPARASKRYRSGAPGQILVSHGQGGGWVHHTGFGPDFEVVAVRQEGDGVFAHLRFQGQHGIHLRLDANERDWKVL